MTDFYPVVLTYKSHHGVDVKQTLYVNSHTEQLIVEQAIQFACEHNHITREEITITKGN